LCEGPSPNYQVQRPHACASARGHAALARAPLLLARGRALYASPVRCNAELGDGWNSTPARSEHFPEHLRGPSWSCGRRSKGHTSNSGTRIMPPRMQRRNVHERPLGGTAPGERRRSPKPAVGDAMWTEPGDRCPISHALYGWPWFDGGSRRLLAGNACETSLLWSPRGF
jgi:hypothetical protein